jgi:hypothetical protein
LLLLAVVLPLPKRWADCSGLSVFDAVIVLGPPPFGAFLTRPLPRAGVMTSLRVSPFHCTSTGLLPECRVASSVIILSDANCGGKESWMVFWKPCTFAALMAMLVSLVRRARPLAVSDVICQYNIHKTGIG